mmetsp:Transcript_71068/g.114658  ORF Transcript_71068/g.114658 Transcript_71068/m.114658 type:complete len:103 (-) Transcript_71068:373-681(-)
MIRKSVTLRDTCGRVLLVIVSLVKICSLIDKEERGSSGRAEDLAVLHVQVQDLMEAILLSPQWNVHAKKKERSFSCGDHADSPVEEPTVHDIEGAGEGCQAL